MRILIAAACPNQPEGGVVNVVYNTVESLRVRGHEVTCLFREDLLSRPVALPRFEAVYFAMRLAREACRRRVEFDGVRCRIDRTLHSLFGASKASADLMAQEYGRYFGMKVGIFRGGCLTGPSHSGVELHGFLSYLVKVAISGGTYSVFGYKAKQVRDNIHSYDVVRAIEEFASNPRPGEGL
jgi:nucleoside-diphosphate-sugar epimerase